MQSIQMWLDADPLIDVDGVASAFLVIECVVLEVSDDELRLHFEDIAIVEDAGKQWVPRPSRKTSLKSTYFGDFSAASKVVPKRPANT